MSFHNAKYMVVSPLRIKNNIFHLCHDRIIKSINDDRYADYIAASYKNNTTY